MTALERVLDALREAGRPVTRSGDGWRSSCPAHDGQNRTALSIDQGRDGVLVYCHADITCQPAAIAAALGLSMQDLFDRPDGKDGRTGGTQGRREPTAVYDYVDENGELLYQVLRFGTGDGKTFRQRRPDERGGWTYRTKGVRRVLYRLPEVLAAVREGRTVYFVEGEKDADAIAAAGAVATSITNGSKGRWSEEYTAALTGAHVVIVADNDAPGLAHARRVRGYLDGRAASVRIVRAAVDREKADASDHLNAGHDLADFVPLGENDLAGDDQDATGARRVRSQPLTQITRRRRQYLWDQRLPLGELTIFAGHAGIGKSQAAVWLAARVTRGELPGELQGEPTPVLYLGTEDSWEYTLAPRFDAAGADPSKVFRLYVETETGEEDVVSLAVDLDDLRAEIEATGARLIVLDALLSTFGSAKLTEQGVVRRHLEPLARLAQELNIAVVGVAHFRKASDSNPLHMLAGSVEFGQVVRSAIGFAPDREAEDGSCVLSLIKTNIAPSGLPSLRYRIEPCTVDTDDGPTDVGHFVLLGETDQGIEDLLNREHTTAEDRSERDEAAEWLLTFLRENGWEVARAEVMKAARKEGFSDSTIKRAKTHTKVRHASGGFPRTTVWIHPDFSTESNDAVGSPPREPTGGEPTGPTGVTSGNASSVSQSAQGHVREPTGAQTGRPTRKDATHSDECAVPGCTRTPRRSCWTCADHMDQETDFGSAA